MAVKFVPKFTVLEIREIMKERKARIEEAIISVLKRTGEQFVKNARDNGAYTDRTGNLRSSIGYVILKDGVQLFENFRRVGRGGKEGPTVAQEVLEQAITQFKTGYVLIGVAGMNYAAAVESKGYDVITASSKLAEVALEQAVTRIASKIPKMR